MPDSTCRQAGKIRYASKKAAQRAIFEIRLRAFANSGRGGQGRQARRCQHCSGFHVVMPDASPSRSARS